MPHDTQAHSHQQSCDRTVGVAVVDLDRAEYSHFLVCFGQNLRTLRAHAGLSQSKLAALCFLRPYEVSDFERGQRVPNLVALSRLADALDSSIGALTRGLIAPHRESSSQQVLARIVECPGVEAAELRAATTLPPVYVDSVLRRLAAMGAIVSSQGGWKAQPKALRGTRTPRSGVGSPLTTREQEVFALLSRASSDAQIALALGISVRTAQTHVARILRKHQVSDRTHLRQAAEAGP